MNLTHRPRSISHAIRLAACLVFSTQGIALASGSVLDCVSPNADGNGYNQFAWAGMTADLNTANGSPLATTSDLSNLSQLMAYNGLWVDVRQPHVGTLTTTEMSNLQTFIASGRRVVLIGGPGPQTSDTNYGSWNDAILSAVQGPTGATYFTSNSTPAYATSPATAGVSSIAVPSGAVAASGTTLFADRVATVWGPARNAIVLLDIATLGDDNLAKLSDSTFAKNLATWVAGGDTDGACLWLSNTGGSWQDNSRWQLSEQPSIADDATFNLSSAGYIVTVAAPLSACNLIVQNDHVTVDLSSTSSNLTMAQAISIGQTAGSSGVLTLTRSSGGAPATIGASALSLGNAGSGSLTVSSGVQLNIAGPITVSAASSLTINGGTLSTTNLTSAGTVSITAGTIHITADVSHKTLNTLHSLTIGNTGTLDLANADLDLQTGNLAAITGDVRTGYANGTWTGTGITSSVAAGDTTHLTALGMILNGNTYGSGTTLGLFDGTSPAATDILIRYTYFGDANLDGQIDGSDYTKIDNGFANRLTGWANGDFNYDGIVDGSDYTLVDNAFNTQGGNLSSTNLIAASTAQLSRAVPEPAAFGSVIAIATALAVRRRRMQPRRQQPNKPDSPG